MRSHEEYPPMESIYTLLHLLQIPPTCKGFFYAAYATWLCVRQPDRLLLVTKWLYPDVAVHYGTHWHNVERSIRRVIAISWHINPHLMGELAGYPLPERPTASQFLMLLTDAVTPRRVA